MVSNQDFFLQCSWVGGEDMMRVELLLEEELEGAMLLLSKLSSFSSFIQTLSII